jgi:ketosteroid isomerase-like protein
VNLKVSTNKTNDNMKKMVFSLLLAGSLVSVSAQSKDEKAVETATSQLVKALESGIRADLEGIASDQLSYGHSNGLIEDKAAFVEAIASGKSDFVKIDISKQTVAVSGKTAIVRHRLDGVTNNSGTPGEIHLNILLVFRKENGGWKLYARQAARVI